MKEVHPGISFRGFLVLRKLTQTTTPPAWDSHPDRTWLAMCLKCKTEVKVHESAIRHNRKPRHMLVDCVSIDDLIEELDQERAENQMKSFGQSSGVAWS